MSRRKLVPALAVVALGLGGPATVLYRDPEGAGRLERKDASIVFVCKNGVAMSVWSALMFEKIAAKRGLDVRVASRASNPDLTRIPLNMRVALALDGFRTGAYLPRIVGVDDLQSADRVILIDTELPASLSVAPGMHVERWGGFPPMREEYFASRAALHTRVAALVERLALPANDPYTERAGAD
jgi:protein-tyrosine-phosphatase